MNGSQSLILRTSSLAILLCAFWLIPANTSGQTKSYGNFKVTDQEIIYQKVFMYDSITLDMLGNYYATVPVISDIDMSNNELSFKVNDLIVDYKKFGFSQVSTPPIIQTGKYSGIVSVSAKDGRYRVTVRSIQLTGDIGYKKITSKERLTNYACRDNGTYISSDWTKPNTLGLLDKAFTDKLEFVSTGQKKDNDDW